MTCAGEVVGVGRGGGAERWVSGQEQRGRGEIFCRPFFARDSVNSESEINSFFSATCGGDLSVNSDHALLFLLPDAHRTASREHAAFVSQAYRWRAAVAGRKAACSSIGCHYPTNFPHWS